MFTPDQYVLLDFGNGRRLERFAGVLLDRPAPAVEEMTRADPDAWRHVDARFDRLGEEKGEWTYREELPETWTLRHEQMTLELRMTQFGHLGVFPEQAANWDWIARRLAESSTPANVLNLFAYTGGSTLAAAAAGAEVVHVDAARNTVARARRNTELSGMAQRPIRWIDEDALKFVRREVKRGNGYDAVILDPPSYGHGPHGEVWRLAEHLSRLLDACAHLTAGRCRFILLTCHTPGFDPPRLEEMMTDALGDGGKVDARRLTIRAATGRDMPAGVVVRWQRVL